MIARQESVTQEQPNSSKWLIVMGALWLILAGAFLIYQLSVPPTVMIEWTTATEINTAGFYIYRSETPDGEFELINGDNLIQSQGSATSGATYQYEDQNVQAGRSYYYVLEEIEFDATRNRYDDDLFSYDIPRIKLVTIIFTLVSVVIGTALLVTGIKEGR